MMTTKEKVMRDLRDYMQTKQAERIAETNKKYRDPKKLAQLDLQILVARKRLEQETNPKQLGLFEHDNP